MAQDDCYAPRQVFRESKLINKQRNASKYNKVTERNMSMITTHKQKRDESNAPGVPGERDLRERLTKSDICVCTCCVIM